MSLVLVLCTIVYGSLFFCVGASAKQVTLKVFLRESNLQEYEWEKKVLAAFEDQNPDIKIEIITEAGGDYGNKLVALWAAGEAPDVWDHGGPVRDYVEKGWLLDLMPYVERDKAELNIKDFFPGAWAAYRSDGKQWGMPFMSVPSFLWVNMELLDQSGLGAPPVSWDDRSWNWDQVRSYAKKITRKSPENAFLKLGLGVIHWAYLDITYSWLGGGDWFDAQAYEKGIPSRPTFATPENELAYQIPIDMVYQEGTAAENYTFEVVNRFSHGDVGMIIGEGPWLVMGRTKDIHFQWAMAPNPWGKSQASMIYTDPWMINSQTKYPEQAWKLVKYLTSRDVMQSYMSFAVFPPARRSVLSGYLNTLAAASGHHTAMQILEALSGAQQYGRETPQHVIAAWPDYDAAISSRLPQAWANQKPVKNVLLEIDEALTGIVKRNQK